MFFRSILSLAFALSGCAVPTSRVVEATPPPIDGSSSAALDLPVPIVDYHRHLMGPAVTEILNGPTFLPAIDLPQDLSELLRERSARWNDPAGLAAIYTPDATVLTDSRRGWRQGNAEIGAFLGNRFGRSYQLLPVDLQGDAASATISGYYIRSVDGVVQHLGYFQIVADKQVDGAWRISSEAPIFPIAPERQPSTAAQLVSELDRAGISRALVLSEGFWADSILPLVPDAAERVVAENDWTAAQAAQFPDRLIAFCSFNPLAAHALRELERCAADRRFRGLKFSFAMSRVDLKQADDVAQLRSVFAAADRHGLPIIVHLRGGNDYGREHVEIFLGQLMTVAPDIPVQIAHLWGGEEFSSEALDALAAAVSTDRPEARNLRFDLAEILSEVSRTGDLVTQRQIVERIRQIGLERILFGSDGARPRESWSMLVTSLGLTAAEARMIAANVEAYAQPGARR